MMKRRKMLLSMMLTAGLIVGMLPATALAAEVEAGEPTEIVVQAEEEASEPTEIAVQAEGLHGHPLCGSKCPDGQHNGTIFGQTLNSSNGTLTIAGKEATQDADGKYELSAGEYYLADNVDLNKGITIQGNVQICLNNKQIRLSDKGAVFTVNDNGNELTLTDCGENGAVSHLASYLGSGVAVNNGAAFNMYGGEISNNASANGVRMIKGSFNMYGGRITNNTDTSSGGGVYAYKSTFNMYGGEISGNRVENANYNTNGGGGVWVKDGTFCMSGGSITGNTAYRNGSYGQGGGVRCIGNTKVELSGSPVIKDNGVTTGAVNNLYVDTGSSNVTITGPLTNGAEIHIVKNGDNAATVASGVDASNANQYIICDDTDYEASYDAVSNTIKWTVPTHIHTWDEWISNGNGTHTRTCKLDESHTETNNCSGVAATCQRKSVCEICHTEYGDFAPHDFDTSTWGYKGADGHAHVCKTSGCTATDTVIAHTPGAAATEDTPQTCTECGYEITPALNHEHNWSVWTSNGDGTHTRTCLDHPDHTQMEKCSGGTATCKDKAVCTICNTAYGELNPANHAGGTEVRNYVAATTEAAGYTGDTWCKGCNTKIADGTTIPKLNSSSDDDDDDDTPAVSDSGNNTSAGVASSPVIEDYTIKRGDTLGAIAKKYGCTVAELVAANSDLIKNPNRIYAGWKLKIPQKGAIAAAATQPDNKNAEVYTIKQGDSLWAIARKYGCTVADIVKLNSNLITMPDRIRVGWQLNMPVK